MSANLDIDLLRAFVAIAETGGFTRACDRLLRTQSSLSLQIKRLEDRLGRRVFERTPRSLRLTADGEALMPKAQALLAMHDAMLAQMREPPIEGVVRVGAPEDFATAHLPEVLSRFAVAHPKVVLEVICDLTLNLIDRFRAGELDVVLVKREPSGGPAGVRVWREPLVWVSAGRMPTRPDEPLQLVVSPQPCVYRKRAVDALDRAGLRWRIAYVCGSLAGALAAVRAGLGVAVLPKDLAPAGLSIIDGGVLPDLMDTEIALLSDPLASVPAQRFAEHVIRSLERAGA